MQNRDGQNESIWQNISNENLQKDQGRTIDIFDVVIVGGGITGLTTAILLQKEGKKCLVAESRNLGFGTTGGTTAHLNTFLDTSYPEIERDFGDDASKSIASATKEVIALVKSLVAEFDIDADFEDKDAYLFSQNKDETDELESILNASKKAGVDVSEVRDNGIEIPFEKVICFKHQGQFHPLKYIMGLAKAFQKLGGIICENTFVKSSNYEGDVHEVVTTQGNVKAKNLVYATHIPPGISILSFRNAPYRSYVLAVKLKNDNYPDCLAYDMIEPYHYFRSHVIDDQKYLIIGGEDHKTGHDDPDLAFEKLENYARQTFDLSEISFKWSSQYYVPVDGLPYIGLSPMDSDKIYVATGFNGNGMILGSLSAMIISDLILGRENRYAELLSPSRLKPVAGFTEFIKENADVIYHFVADRFGAEALKTIDELQNDEGKIVDYDGDKLAIYKNKDGQVTALNPTCTHAGCIVNWNGTEKSWDCPCHGGRFSTCGKVMSGPPRKDLTVVSLTENGA